LKTALAFLAKNKGKIAIGASLVAVAANYAAGTLPLTDALSAALQLVNPPAP
jgi:hypothetical protein